MPDRFDELASELGITRQTAIRSYCPDALADAINERDTLKLALHLVCKLAREISVNSIETIENRLTMAAEVNQDLTLAVDTALAALRDPTG